MKNLTLAVVLVAAGSGLSATGASASTITLALGEVDTTVAYTSGHKINADYGFVVSATEADWMLGFSFNNNVTNSHSYQFGAGTTLKIYAGTAATGTALYSGTVVQFNSGTMTHPLYSDIIVLDSGNTFELAKGTYNVQINGVNSASFTGTGNLAITASVPEVSTWAMMMAGFAGLGLVGYGGSNKVRGLAA